MRVKVKVTGVVQGVGFRPFIYRTAIERRLCGYVRNRGDAGVEILLEGKTKAIQDFLQNLRRKKPPLARIYNIISSKLDGENEYAEFTIQKSSDYIELAGSVIPPDIATCDDCLRELRDSRNHRHGYFFITCTNCGPRFTVIKKLPYDRENTTMNEFPMCDFCQNEYKDPLNRRFHAQTVACPTCGPKVYLTTSNGELIEHKEPIQETGKLLSEGEIVAIKGYGGFHIAVSTSKDKPLTRLREIKHRSQKPFAIMARSLKEVETLAEVNQEEMRLLSSWARPIVLLAKSREYCLSDLVAPRLHNVGIMLPYSGLHYVLFDKVNDSSFVMTSGNPPNQPIVNDNDEALRLLSNTVDYFLFHNRQIAHRCDDSVIRVHKGNAVMLRRSRGYAPAPVILKKKARKCVVGLGGELNNTSCILNRDRAFISPHIGDVENIETRDFLKAETEHIIQLTNSKIDGITCDLHPRFTTTKLAHDLAEELGCELVQVQHHYAHLAGLSVEHDLDEIVGICCDGYGYGSDGQAWGGEIIFCSRETFGFERLAHLEKQLLLGGDLSTRYPLRIAAGILRDERNMPDWLLQHVEAFPHGEHEIQVILSQLHKRKGTITTTSCGRVLDAVSAVLDVCLERTYEGEPSMKLESIARDGRDILGLKPLIQGNTLNTTQLVKEIFENRERHHTADLAYSAHMYLAKGLATLAIEQANKKGVKTIGFSGGVAFNEILSATLRRIIEHSDMRFLVHENVPPGDGGLSFGQAAAIGFS